MRGCEDPGRRGGGEARRRGGAEARVRRCEEARTRRSSRSLFGKDHAMIVGAPLVGARNADNACQCEHGNAEQCIAMHCPQCCTLLSIARIAPHCPATTNHGDLGARCSAMDGNAGTHKRCPYNHGRGIVGHCGIARRCAALHGNGSIGMHGRAMRALWGIVGDAGIAGIAGIAGRCGHCGHCGRCGHCGHCGAMWAPTRGAPTIMARALWGDAGRCGRCGAMRAPIRGAPTIMARALWAMRGVARRVVRRWRRDTNPMSISQKIVVFVVFVVPAQVRPDSNRRFDEGETRLV